MYISSPDIAPMSKHQSNTDLLDNFIIMSAKKYKLNLLVIELTNYVTTIYNCPIIAFTTAKIGQ